MKGKYYIIVIILLILLFGVYNNLKINKYDKLVLKHNNLVDKYNNLTDIYNNVPLIKYDELIKKYNEQINITKFYKNESRFYKNESTTYKWMYEIGPESCTLENVELTKKIFGYRGMYYGEGYYCVWVKNWNMSDIKHTENHEICHAMVNDDYGHFCE